MSKITSRQTIKRLGKLFSTFGIPHHIVSDNGRQYTSEEFENFVKNLGIKHSFTARCHPATNGAAENFVKTFKRKIKSIIKDGVTVEDAITKFLYDYRSTEHSTTGESPAKLMFGRELRTRFNQLRPEIREHVAGEQFRQTDSGKKTRNVKFVRGETVMARDFSKNGPKWSNAEIVAIRSPVTYVVDIDGTKHIRHVDQLLRRGKIDDRVEKQGNNNNETEVRRSKRLAEKLNNK